MTSPHAHSTPYHLLDLDPGGAFVRVTRTSQKFEDVAAIEEEAARVGGLIDAIGRQGRGLVIDTRQGPMPRPEEEYERAHSKMRIDLSRGFDRIAVVVSSAIGKLQVKRLADGEGRGVLRAFDGPEEAEAYARGDRV